MKDSNGRDICLGDTVRRTSNCGDFCCSPENDGGKPENGDGERERVVLSDFYAPIRDRLMTKTKEELVEHIIMGIHFSMQEMLSGHNKEACRVQEALSRMMKQGQEGGEANDTDGNVHENIAAS